ncbi:MAG: efflux RND transporter periplasmic adaptor subunit [Deltaproteobacteria bacterium]|nr:efflux RND transporter periplasmic adaptor subunit [Deltaproteobacteria bacterium]
MSRRTRGCAPASWILLVLAGACAAGCQRIESLAGHDHGDEPGHGHGAHAGHGHGGHGEEEEATLAITKWGAHFELFAEHPLAVVGREVEVLAHVTILEGFRAMETGSVSLELDGPAQIRAGVDRVARPGIFEPVFTPRVAGRYRGRLVVRTASATEALGPIELEVYPTVAAARTANPPGEDPPGRIGFLKEQQWRVPFATIFATTAELAPTTELSGTVTTPPGGSADVGAPVVGRVVAPTSGLPLPGSTVRRGDALATIAPTPSAPESGASTTLEVAAAQSRLAAAEASLARAERLIADRAIPQREVDDARRELAVARAAVAAARQSRRLFVGAVTGRGAGTFRLRAPIDGILVDVAARPGLAVEPGSLLFRIVDPSRLWITARIPEQDAAVVRTDLDAAYQILGLDTWLPIDVSEPGRNAEVVLVGRTVDPRSRTVDLVYALHAPDPRLRIGAAVRVQVPVGRVFRGIAVPRSALVDDDGRDVVYVQPEGESFEERIVRTGVRSGDLVAVTEGLREGERIVTVGANLVRLAARAGSAPAHGHVH